MAVTTGLAAVPSVLEASAVDVFALADARRVHTRVACGAPTGMAMALALRRPRAGAPALELAAGYESGHVAVMRNAGERRWETVYLAQPHSQPVLSLAVYPGGAAFLTTAADSLVVRHPLGEDGQAKVVDTRHLGLQGVSIRGDGKLFATAGWDARFRVFSGRSMKELAVLKWHGVGCYAVDFAEILDDDDDAHDAGMASGGSAQVGHGDGGDTAPGSEAVCTQGGQASELFRAANLSVEASRVRRESRRHWIAGGAKDGKVSMWEIY